jgi:hypothetical protein
MHGVEIRWATLDTPFVINFDENQRGKAVYFCLCRENNTGEKGPWSEIVKAIIP